MVYVKFRFVSRVTANCTVITHVISIGIAFSAADSQPVFISGFLTFKISFVISFVVGFVVFIITAIGKGGIDSAEENDNGETYGNYRLAGALLLLALDHIFNILRIVIMFVHIRSSPSRISINVLILTPFYSKHHIGFQFRRMCQNGSFETVQHAQAHRSVDAKNAQ